MPSVSSANDSNTAQTFDRTLRLIRIGVVAAAVVLAVLFPQLAPDAFILSVGVVIASYAALAVSWNFVGGFTDYISLGHAAYSGIGGYVTALLIIDAGVNPWLALFLATVAVGVVAVPIGIASLRVRGASFVIVSIALVLILLLVAQSWAGVTGGANGLRLPRPFDDLLRPEMHERFYYIHLVFLAAALLLWWAIDRSRFGTGLKAIREDEDKAEALGVPTFRYKLAVFVISATLTATAGGLYALWLGSLAPVFQFSILIGSYMVLMSLLGGIRSLFGPVVGAIIVGVALEFFKSEYGETQLHLVALGVLLGLVVMFMPDGVLPAIGSLINRFRPASTSIREMSAAELAEQNDQRDAENAGDASNADTPSDDNGSNDDELEEAKP